MKLGISLAAIAAATFATSAFATTYSDALGDNFDGNAHMDISSVDVTNTASDITFTITLNGDIAATNWGKYCIGIDSNSATGDTTAPVGNPWGRNINMADGMDAWVGSWVDSGGGVQPWTYAGSWTQNGQVVPALSQFSTSFTLSLASLGLAAGGPIHFDVYSTGGGGGDSANDASSNLLQSTTGWSGPYTTPAGGGHLYNVVVPEPTTLGLLAGASVLGLRRRK